MISFQLVQSTPRHNEVSNRKDRILAHSPGRGSGVQGLLQVSLSWGWGSSKRMGTYWGAGVAHWRNSVLSFLCFREAERTGESEESVAGIHLGVLGDPIRKVGRAVFTSWLRQDCSLRLKSLLWRAVALKLPNVVIL